MKPNKKSTRKFRRAYWQDHISSWQHSGQSQRWYCQDNELALSTFSYWKRKLGKTQQPTRFYPLTIQPDTITLKENQRSGLRLSLSDNRYQIELDSDFSSATLKKLLLILEAA